MKYKDTNTLPMTITVEAAMRHWISILMTPNEMLNFPRAKQEVIDEMVTYAKRIDRFNEKQEEVK